MNIEGHTIIVSSLEELFALIAKAVRDAGYEITAGAHDISCKKLLAPKDTEREYGINQKTLACWRLEGVGPAYANFSRRVFYPTRRVGRVYCIRSYPNLGISQMMDFSAQHLPDNRKLFAFPSGEEMGIAHGHGDVPVAHELLQFHERDLAGLAEEDTLELGFCVFSFKSCCLYEQHRGYNESRQDAYPKWIFGIKILTIII